MNQAACRGRRRLRRAVGTPPRGRSGKMGMGRERKGVKTRKKAEEREKKGVITGRNSGIGNSL